MKCIIALCACIQYQIHFESHLNESVQIYPASSICKQVATTIGTLTPDPSVPWTREEWYTQLLVADCPTYETLTLMMKHGVCGWLSTGLHLQLGQVRTAKNSSYVRKLQNCCGTTVALTMWNHFPNLLKNVEPFSLKYRDWFQFVEPFSQFILNSMVNQVEPIFGSTSVYIM